MKSEQQKKYNREEMRLVCGYRLFYEWTYTDPIIKDVVTIPADSFVTQPYPRGEFRCSLFGARELYIPRAILRRSRTTVLKKNRDKVLLGEMAPKSYWDAPETTQHT